MTERKAAVKAIYVRTFRKCLIPAVFSTVMSFLPIIFEDGFRSLSVAGIGWVICGAVAFRELISGREREMFYSLPIKRADMFKARFSAAVCACSVCLITAFVVMLLWMMCCDLLGAYADWRLGSLVLLFVPALVMLFPCVAVGALGEICSVSKLESAVLPFCMFLLPASVFIGMDLICSRLLYGNSFTDAAFLDWRVFTADVSSNVNSTLRAFDISISPILRGFYSSGDEVAEIFKYVYSSDIVALAVRILVGVALMLLSRYCLIKRTSVLGNPKISDTASTVCMGGFVFFLFGVAVKSFADMFDFDESNFLVKVAAIISAVICSALFMLICRTVFGCRRRKTLLIGSAVNLVAMLAVLCIALSGGLGYETRIPREDKVECAASSFYTIDDVVDTQEIIEKHKKFLEGEVEVKEEGVVGFEYHLKNGNKIRRDYEVGH